MFEYTFPQPINGFRWMLSSNVRPTASIISKARERAKHAKGTSLIFGFTFETAVGTIHMIPLGRA